MSIAVADHNNVGTQLAPAEPPRGKAAGLVVVDDSTFANLLDTSKFEHIWRVANMYAQTKFVPECYQNKPNDCFVACQMAVRLGVDPLMFMQNTYIVHNKPGMEAKLAIALINSSGLFTDGLDYEIDGGTDPFAANYRVRAIAVRKSTGKIVEGPWIDWPLVKKEGWEAKSGSKWKTMPAQMFCYRAATFFGRLHCPERLMGMQTVEEVEDVVGRRVVENEARPMGASALSQRLTFNPERAAGSVVDAGSDNGSSHTTPEAAAEAIKQAAESKPPTSAADLHAAEQKKQQEQQTKPAEPKLDRWGEVMWNELTTEAHGATDLEGPELRAVVDAWLESQELTRSDLNRKEVRAAVGDTKPSAEQWKKLAEKSA